MATEDKISGISTRFMINEATIEEIQSAFQSYLLTSKQLVQHYLDAIKQDKLHAVIEVNPDALTQAEKADNDRNPPGSCCSSRTVYASPMSMLQGIPVLLKDNISTHDKLQTTCGSFALLGSVVPRDATVVSKLRQAGAIILGKANLSQWANFRSPNIPSGWSSRGGTVQNPYKPGEEPGGSSTGSAVSVAANLVTVSLGTETSGSIMSPCNYNCVVGIKPTVGLTSRSGVIPLSSRQDSVGPIGRTVSDAVYLLEVIVGSDPRDEASKESAKYISPNGYTQFLKEDGLNGKRIGNMWNVYKEFYKHNPDDPEPESTIPDQYQQNMDTLRNKGAVLINYENPRFLEIYFELVKNITVAFCHEFKRDLNIYLSNLLESPIRSLADAIAFNIANPEKEKLEEYHQEYFTDSEATNLPSSKYTEAISKLEDISKEVFDTFMIDNNLDAVVAPEAYFVEALAIRGCPSINVPAGFDAELPYGIMFGGFKGSEGKLIEIAFAFEQATKVRKKPPTIAA